MLSRIAESLFWIGRYVERADDTSRIVDAYLQHLLEDAWIDDDLALRSLLGVMGLEAGESQVTRFDVLSRLAYDQASPSSCAGALAAARENARRARDSLSSELWEALNSTWNALPQMIGTSTSHQFFSWVRERAAVVGGITDAATRRDETFQFFLLGRSIERADMTARLISTRAVAGPSAPDWTTLLRSCGAYEVFLRTYRGRDSDSLAAEFLLLDRLFPRSVLYALETAERCLARLDTSEVHHRSEADARRTLGRVRSDLEYQPLLALLHNLPEQMQRVQQGCSEASDAIRVKFFPSATDDEWIGGQL
ncbi:alpha-E domain-containing protein [Pseudactinotalea sp. Z1732]|uniref:alpha-E domain-containing protein n=1 Tax=Micrococcales TaxID=85006 RepID=UPI003C7ABE33